MSNKSFMYLVAIKDVKADVFMVPAFVPNLQTAIRSFGDQVMRADENNVLYKHAEDFELWHIGYFYESNGEIEPLESRALLSRGSEYTRPNSAEVH